MEKTTSIDIKSQIKLNKTGPHIKRKTGLKRKNKINGSLSKQD
jgi:hypothetical protein